MPFLCVDDFEVGIFLRESRTRHSLLTRHKDFDNQTKKEGIVTDAGAGSTLADAEVIMDSDDEPESDLHNVPQAGDEDTPEQGRVSNRRKDAATSEVVDGDYDDGGNDDKKMGFSTRYESFDICGWVLCLLISRKSDKPQPSADPSASKQPLMEEWISTQAQPDMEEA